MTNQNIWKGKWKQLKGEVQKSWGNLTNDELDQLEGNRTKIEGLVQEKYGLKQEEVRRRLDDMETKYSD